MDAEKVTYPAHHWGALANDPWMDIGGGGDAWTQAALRVWLGSGSSKEGFDALVRPATAATER